MEYERNRERDRTREGDCDFVTLLNTIVEDSYKRQNRFKYSISSCQKYVYEPLSVNRDRRKSTISAHNCDCNGTYSTMKVRVIRAVHIYGT
jgi:hypothetical protein